MDQMLKYGLLGALGSGISSVISGLLSLSTNMLVLGYGGYLVLLDILNISSTGFDAGNRGVWHQPEYGLWLIIRLHPSLFFGCPICDDAW